MKMKPSDAQIILLYFNDLNKIEIYSCTATLSVY